MKSLLKFFLPNVFQRWAKLLIALALLMIVFVASFAWLAQASGSRSLYPNGIGGNRANIEWRTSFYGGFLRRRTLLKVYAQAGEVILVGSSAVGVNLGDVQIHNPGQVTGPVGNETIPAVPNFSCQAQRGTVPNPNLGRITSRDQELAGPDTIIDAVNGTPGGVVPNGYVPCFYTATVTGIYDVIFHGAAGGNSDAQINPTGEIDLTSPANFDDSQSTNVSAWDVTVRPGLTSAADINGRLFARYLALFTGANNRLVNSTIYILTLDGYIYQTDLRGFDPNGFLLYANDVGFFDADGETPLYHDAFDGVNNQLDAIQGGVTLAPPRHFVFFELPSNEAITANGVTLTPIDPEITFFHFNGSLGNNDTLVQVGGTFTYTSNVSGTYEIILSRDGLDFDPTNPANRVLRGLRPAGTQTVSWDGLDNAGNPFPVGLNYPVSMTVRAGEYHFPLLDIENSVNGGPTFTLLNPPSGTCPTFYGSPPSCTTGFYDDRGYTTTLGVTVGTPGDILPGNNPPTQWRSDPLQGFDTSTNQRAFGASGNDGFGDKKGLDLWVYFPSPPIETFVNIFAFNLVLDKTDGGGIVAPGGVITYAISYTNTGVISATGVVITEVVPANTIFNPAASSPGWNFTSVTAGSVVTRFVGLVAGYSTPNPAVTFVVTLDDPLPPNVTQIANSAVIGDDGANGPEPTFDNSDTEDTPVLGPPPPTPTPQTPTIPPPSSDDDDDDDDAVPTPTPTPPSSAAAEFSPPQPTPTLPVLFLPETGLREAETGIGLGGGAIALLTLFSIGLTIYYVRKKPTK